MDDEQHIKSRLDSMNKELPFSVPENYFDNFASRLQERMQTGKKPGLFRKTYELVRPQLALAAAIAAFLAIGYTTVRLIMNDEETTDNVVEIADVINYYFDDFDDDMLISTLAEENGIDWLNTSMEGDDILDYLSEENNLDYSELIDLY
ncbi:MAG: hypothetical protein AMS27_05080 [Bacteroides sp. SM23_62_1]|nr:MAG: hypothetical protein AMS27_05080 [Bacteroides sp. SM23_62_1]